MDLFDLVAKLTLDSSEYNKGLSESAENGEAETPKKKRFGGK